MKKLRTHLMTGLTMVLFLMFTSNGVLAHCDSYDGPLIKDAIKALKMENVNPVLKWIEPSFEEEIKSLFLKTVSLKKGDPEVYSIVEKHFLETLVRLHRQGEGAPFTGLKPAGSVSEILVLADNALAENDLEMLSVHLTNEIADMLKSRYDEAQKKSITKENSIAEGREYVKAYIQYTHFLEELQVLMSDSGLHQEHLAEKHAD